MVTTKQKPVLGTQNIKRKDFKHSTEGNHQIIKEENKEGTEKLQKSQKTIS